MDIRKIGIGAIIVLALALLVPQSPVSLGGAGLGTYQQIATSTVVGALSANTIFDANNNCRARVITTLGQEVNLLFGDPTNGDLSSTSISDLVGHVQAASTTVVYSSDDVGCGRWIGFAEASTTLTVSEF